MNSKIAQEINFYTISWYGNQFMREILWKNGPEINQATQVENKIVCTIITKQRNHQWTAMQIAERRDSSDIQNATLK